MFAERDANSYTKAANNMKLWNTICSSRERLALYTFTIYRIET